MSSAEQAVAAEPVRVVHVVNSLEAGGTELVLATLIERTGEKYQHALCSLHGTGPGSGRLARLQVPITHLGKREGHDWGLALRVARLCRRLRPHVVHARNWGSIDGVIGARLAGVPVVIHSEHGRDRSDLDGIEPRRIWGRRLLTPWIDTHVVVSMDLRRWLVERVGIPASKVVLVRNGVDTERFHPHADRERLRGELGYSTRDLVFIALGRLDPVKDHATLLQAFRRTAQRHPEARLTIVGCGTERAALEETVRREALGERVRLVGHRDDVETWLAAADVFAHASLMEGMSNALLEAMAAGLPVVATSAGGNPEIVVPGVNGILVPPADPTALAEAMAYYCADAGARATHGAAGRMHVRTNHPLASMLAGYSRVYDEALARRARGLSAFARRRERSQTAR